MDWIKWAGIAAGAIVALALGVDDITTWYWNKSTQALVKQLISAKQVQTDAPFNDIQLVDLPPPVQRYLRIALKNGQPIIKSAKFSHAGAFNMSAADQAWKPFTSNQTVVVNRPGFVWDARVKMFPLVNVNVHDAYIAGEGSLRASILGMFDVANMKGSEVMAQSELLRFLAETPLYPTSLLARKGMNWKAIDDHAAQITLTDLAIQVTMTFRFNDDGLIDTVWAAARGRISGKIVDYMPWQGRFWNYAECGGIMVPLEAEVEWLTPEGPKPYYRGKLTAISFEY